MSTATILAPRSLRARVACVITLTWVLTALVPQITTRSDFAISRGSGPASVPVPAMKPVHDGVGADGGMKAGIALGVAQPVDAVAHDEAHGAGVVVGPDRLRAVALLGREEFLGDEIERVVPGDRRELARALRRPCAQRMHQPVGMMHALGIARDLGADDAGRVVVVRGAAHAADGVRVEQLDLERAGRGAVVRAGGGAHDHVHRGNPTDALGVIASC